MKYSTAYIASVRAIFGDGDECLAAEALFTHLEKFPKTKHISIGLMHRIVSVPLSDHAIVRALQYLSGENVNFLRVKFEFLREEDDPHDISDVEARDVLNFQINPFTGREDSEAAKKLLIYFEPKDLKND